MFKEIIWKSAYYIYALQFYLHHALQQMAPTVSTISFFMFFYEIPAVSDDIIMWQVSPDTSPTTGASAFFKSTLSVLHNWVKHT